MIENDPFPRFYLWSLIDYDVYFGAYLKLTLGYFFTISDFLNDFLFSRIVNHTF